MQNLIYQYIHKYRADEYTHSNLAPNRGSTVDFLAQFMSDEESDDEDENLDSDEAFYRALFNPEMCIEHRKTAPQPWQTNQARAAISKDKPPYPSFFEEGKPPSPKCGGVKPKESAVFSTSPNDFYMQTWQSLCIDHQPSEPYNQDTRDFFKEANHLNKKESPDSSPRLSSFLKLSPNSKDICKDKRARLTCP